MAEDRTIGQLDDGGTIQAGDEIPIKRGTENARVVVGTAGTKAASDASKDKVASVNGSTNIGHHAVFSDENGTVGDGGAVGANITGAPILNQVLTTDYTVVVRGGVIYLALVSDLLDAQAPSGGGGQYDFSDSINSAYAAII